MNFESLFLMLSISCFCYSKTPGCRSLHWAILNHARPPTAQEFVFPMLGWRYGSLVGKVSFELKGWKHRMQMMWSKMSDKFITLSCESMQSDHTHVKCTYIHYPYRSSNSTELFLIYTAQSNWKQDLVWYIKILSFFICNCSGSLCL